MPEQYREALQWLEQHPQLFTLIGASLLVLAAWIANWLVKRILLRGLYRALRATALGQDSVLNDSKVIARLANIVPALILSLGVGLIAGLPAEVVTVVRNVCGAFVVLTLALAISEVLGLVNTLYQRRPDAHLRPIKGYVQVLKIAVFAIAAILIIAALIDRSPLILLSGLGAMAAVLLLIFQDTLLSLVASVQISSNDIIRVGDWVEMPQLNADGDVIDIALHTVKVQNWDKTITTIPTKRFITDSFKNWRGMQESGGRRIKRCLHLDQNSVRFLDAEGLEQLHRFDLIGDYLEQKRAELQQYNAGFGDPLNGRQLTNLGTFRAYVERYLRNHPEVHPQMTLLVRHLQPGESGLPLEIYCFTNTVAWAQYERIQADIFDHLLAILPAFGLRVFQNPGGADFQRLAGADR
ncbi:MULTISPECIES: mechanosensitive ion channel family protein [unclassified Pseudomonas]|uniref:mechanosensitive ion channel family protein n=1 Tax=unclassified Pseudomonas TaxID=196821 RepID=UPI002449325E|nr:MULTISPECIES: mechanosensitive ion channel family protein [unclassified Pseudomonas]MDG9928214.1 mechanosensitive ion channel family protein [Pseudomonas sp. GD04042]MDH0481222.1 mechanosensitive ion channel family protein [Pseudomonas sp. GD04015]MDH0605129.1 mechanosensitive ion channel family protein [Pseudomonas sp. GD03869]